MSIRAIADAVGVTPPSIYLHFADKEGLLFAVSERYFRQLGAVTNEAAAASDDPVESLRLRGKAYVRFGVGNPEPYRILFMTRPGTPSDMSGVLEGPSGFAELVGAVKRCMDAGVFGPDDPLKVATGLWATVHGITSLLIARPDFPWLDAEAVVDHLLMVQTLGLSRSGQD